MGLGGTLQLGAGAGRGAWLCDDIGCLDAAERRRAFSRALRADVNPGAIARLREAWPLRPGDASGPDGSAAKS